MTDEKTDIENGIISIVIDSEVNTEKNNKKQDNDDFEAVLDMLECKRTEKDYDWQSNLFIPEYPSIWLTDSSGWAGQYFPSRDFVDVYLGDDEPQSKQKSMVAKKTINKILNDRNIFYYHKYMRARTLNSTAGQVYAICYWEREIKQELKGYRDIPETLNVDIYGNEMIDPTIQIPARRMRREPIYEEVPIFDRFNFEVIDPRNVYTDNIYCYSAQQKEWITIRSEKTYDNLLNDQNSNGYFNLDKIKEKLKSQFETETSKETYNKDDNSQRATDTPVKPFDVYERFGKFWCIVKERNGRGEPVEIESGIDTYKNIKDGAELLETIIAVALVGNEKVLIRFQPTPYYDAKGKTYKPIVRGWCYIHPTKDSGLSDGKYNRELQKAINDTVNMSNDRVKLSTIPVFKGNRLSLQDNTSVYIEPGHVIEMENPQTDLLELNIKDNVQGAMMQWQLFKTMEEQVSGIYPTTMGQLPTFSSTSATAVAGAEQRTDRRNNYKSLTFEYSFLIEFYWMILQMVFRFARKETVLKLMGRDAIYFDPDADYTYTPLSSNIETEYNKFEKIKMWDQILGRVVNMPNPKTPVLVNFIITQIIELMGNEFSDFKRALLDENAPVEPGGNAPPDMKNRNISPESNQNNIPMSILEQRTRGV